jgi:hypothetical protein
VSPWPRAALAPTMACGLMTPDQVHMRHPHTIDDDSCAWFHRSPSGARVVVPSLTVVLREVLE